MRLVNRNAVHRSAEAEVTEDNEAWGRPLWPAADLITPMALRVAATLLVVDAITRGVASGRRSSLGRSRLGR